MAQHFRKLVKRFSVTGNDGSDEAFPIDTAVEATPPPLPPPPPWSGGGEYHTLTRRLSYPGSVNNRWMPETLGDAPIVFVGRSLEPRRESRDRNIVRLLRDCEMNDQVPRSMSEEGLMFTEPWFHGRIEPEPGKNAREISEEIVRASRPVDGTFLVRESVTFRGDYSITFWADNKVNHCRIKSRVENGQVRYYLVESKAHDSLSSLVNHFRREMWRTMQTGNMPGRKHRGRVEVTDQRYDLGLWKHNLETDMYG